MSWPARAVIVMARSRPETMQAILAWALEGHGEGVALAPVSALLAGMVERIATQIPLPVKGLDPLLGLPASRRITKRYSRDSRLVVAAGLAMGA